MEKCAKSEPGRHRIVVRFSDGKTVTKPVEPFEARRSVMEVSHD